MNLDDLRLVVMAAVAFNEGLMPRDDRALEDIERITLACQRLGNLCNLEVKS